MKILIFEPMRGGHFTNYIEALAAYASAHLAGRTPPATVAIAVTARHAGELAPAEPPVEIDASLPELPHSMALGLSSAPRYAATLRALWKAFSAAVERHAPDRVIVPSADHLTLAAALAGQRRARALLDGREAVAVLHQGYAGLARGTAERVKDRLYRGAWRRAPWTRLLSVNPALVDWLATRDPGLGIGLCPDPVPPFPPMARAEACARLGLDPGPRYLGAIGAVRERMAFPTIVEAFARQSWAHETRLLIAGRIEHPAHRAYLETDPTPKALGARLVTIDRHLSAEELVAGYAASDIVLPLYRRSHALSANLLKAIGAGKPALVSDQGFSAYMATRFPVGETCPADDPAAAAAALGRLAARLPAVDARDDPRPGPNPAVARLLAFHAPENFARCLFGAVAPGEPAPVDWPLAGESA